MKPPQINVSASTLEKNDEVVSTICKRCLKLYQCVKNSEAHITQMCSACWYSTPKKLQIIGRA